MRSAKDLESSLSEIVDAIKTVDGVIGIILFGSTARGDHDEGSDIDLLIIFKDQDAMRKNEWEVTRSIPSDIFAQSICVCPSTLETTNPVFLQSVLEDGVILYMQHPLVLKIKSASLAPYLIVSFGLGILSQREKQKIDYKLFGRVSEGRSYAGLVEEHDGRRLGRGCFLIPKEDSESVLSLLDEHGLRYELLEAYLPKIKESPLRSLSSLYSRSCGGAQWERRNSSI